MTSVDPSAAGKEYSHAQKIEIVRRQIQLRKQHDGIKQMGDMVLSNRTGKNDPSPEEGLLELLINDFRAILQHEAVSGIPAPKVPALVKPREATTGATKLAAELLDKQRVKAAAFTRAFYATHQQGYFEAFRMTRTRVPQPKQYIGSKFKKLFENGAWHSGEIIEYHDDVQRWKALYGDGDGEDFTTTDMKKYLGPRFACGAIRNIEPGPTTAASIRAASRKRRLEGRSNPLDGAVAELLDVAAGAEFELPAHYVKTAGTRWKLLRVYLEESTGRQVAAYCPADEAAAIPDADIAELALEDLEREYDVEVAEYSAVQAWVSASATTAAAAEQHSDLRRSRRLNRAS
jgi:hypothetical protein